MLNAIVAAHAPKGLWATNGGMEYPLVLATAAASLAMLVSGGWALDWLVDFDMTATWAAIGVIGGIVVGLAGLAFRRPQPSPDERRQRLQAA